MNPFCHKFIEDTLLWVIFLFMAATLLSGCAVQSPEQIQQRQDQNIIDAANWARCERLYNGINRRTWSQHPHRPHRPHSPFEISEDLRLNHCHTVLGDYWETLQ